MQTIRSGDEWKNIVDAEDFSADDKDIERCRSHVRLFRLPPMNPTDLRTNKNPTLRHKNW